ncbi:ABC transporter permease subunit [Canibacter sp. lx-45]|uniref:ABC transporter permease n=1 Tax=Canibacter zhuwentaonis TaxID=2837491 RepID=UPI001BDD6C77|nr:ABC transporter permease subunit [Canibacter zhuwentaonis]MBT1035129.1 ABC transporter permease subunit [Canibacter zhuwentaonis]
MNLLQEAIAWLINPANWSGAGGVLERILQHLLITAASVALASAVALPVGIIIGHTKKAAGFVPAVTGAMRAVPTLGILTVFALMLGIGFQAPLLALTVLAIPSVLAGVYSGVNAVDHTVTNAAKAIGMKPTQIVFKVEIPLALPLIIGGVRAATLQVVATATLAAYTADIGLGRYLFAGLKSRDYTEMLAAALLVTALALIIEIPFGVCERFAKKLSRNTSNG